jgi:hypothetical protein
LHRRYGDGAIGVIEDQPALRLEPPSVGAEGNDDSVDDGVPTAFNLPWLLRRRDPAMDHSVREHPEAFQVGAGPGGEPLLYVNVAERRCVAVIDAGTPGSREQDTWTLPEGLSDNFPMAIDHAGGCLLVGVRRTESGGACVLVLSLASGSPIERIAVGADMDDILFDTVRRRAYVVSGAGTVTVLAAVASARGSCDTYAAVGPPIPTAVGARTGLWSEKRRSLYVAAPATATTGARLLVFQDV